MKVPRLFSKDNKTLTSIASNVSEDTQGCDLKVFLIDSDNTKPEYHNKDIIHRTLADTIEGEVHLINYSDLYNVSVKCTFQGEMGVKNDHDILSSNLDTNSMKIVVPLKWKRNKKETQFHTEEFLKKELFLFGNENLLNKGPKPVVENGLTRGKHVFPFKINLTNYDKTQLLDSVWFLNGFLNYQLILEIISDGQVIKTFSLNVIINSINSTSKEQIPVSYGKHIKDDKDAYKFIMRADKAEYSYKEMLRLSYGLKLLDTDSKVFQNSNILLSNIGLLATLYRYIKIDKPGFKTGLYNQKISQTFSPLIINKHKFTKGTIDLKFDTGTEFMPSTKTKLFSISYYVELDICFKYVNSIKTFNNEVIKLGSFENLSNLGADIDPNLLSYKIKEDFLEKRGGQDLVQDDLRMIITSNFLKPELLSQKERLKVVVKSFNYDSKYTPIDKQDFEENDSFMGDQKFDLYESLVSKVAMDDDDNSLSEEKAPEFY